MLLAVVLVPVLQAELHFITEKKLAGAFTVTPKPALSWEGLRDNTYQPALEHYLEDSIGFRPTLIRLRNQLAFSLFKMARSSDIVVGRHGVLFQPAHITSYQGRDLFEEAEVNFQVRRLRAVQRELAQRGVQLLFVMAPNKARFQPENLPMHLRPAPGTVTNYDRYMRAMRADTVAVLDMVPLFAHWKGTKPYPLFPRGGTHWSGYGATLAADTLLRRLEQMGNLHFPTVRTIGPPVIIRNADSLRATDNDIGGPLNLLQQAETTPLAYPHLAFDPPRPGQTRPSALFVGDSFTLSLMYFSPYIQREFADDSRLWYYGYTVRIPDSVEHNTGDISTNLDWRAQIESRRFIVLLLTEHNFAEHFFKFVDRVYRLYHPLTAANKLTIDQIAQKLAREASWDEQAKNPDEFAQKNREKAEAIFERQQPL
jgi:hypothetical protein